MPRTTSKKPQSEPKTSATRTTVTPRDVFLHLLLIGTLYASVISVLILLFQYIDLLFPDQLHYSFYASTSAIRSATATLLVVWPVFLVVSLLLGRDFAAVRERKELWIRKWLIYLTLLIAAVTMIVELVQLIYRFLGGELTVQFVLKVVVVFAAAGLVFAYYVWDLRRSGEKTNMPRIFGWVVTVVLLGTIIAGFWIAGSPMTQRDRRFDEQRVWDLQLLQSEVINYWASKGSLPEKLDDLSNTISGFVPPKDPRTSESYEYAKLSELVFELCATFASELQNTSPRWFESGKSIAVPYPPDSPYGQNWSHDAGRQCFTRTIDPDFYPDTKFRKPEPVPVQPLVPLPQPQSIQ